IHEQPHAGAHADQRRFPFAARSGDGLGVLHVNPAFQAIPRQRAIHRAGVHVNVAERPGHELRVRALAARARAINGDDNRLFQVFPRSRRCETADKIISPSLPRSHERGYSHSANNSSSFSFRPVFASRIVAPRPFGGGAASFWKKFGNVFFTQAGFLILMPGTFNPRIAKHIAMRWSLYVSISAP